MSPLSRKSILAAVLLAAARVPSWSEALCDRWSDSKSAAAPATAGHCNALQTALDKWQKAATDEQKTAAKNEYQDAVDAWKQYLNSPEVIQAQSGDMEFQDKAAVFTQIVDQDPAQVIVQFPGGTANVNPPGSAPREQGQEPTGSRTDVLPSDAHRVAPDEQRDLGSARDVARKGSGAAENNDLPTMSPETRSAARDLSSGDTTGAVKKLDAAVQKNPNDASAYGLRAQVRAGQGDRDGALADARQALALNPKDNASRAMISEYEGLSRAQGKTKSAKLDFAAAGSAGAGGSGTATSARAGGAPGQPSPALGGGAFAGGGYAARQALHDAALRLAMGDYSGALLILQRARDRDPNNSAILDMIAQVSNAAKNPAGAIAAADAALKLNPKDAAALREKAYAELSLGQYDAALADIQSAVALEPQNGLGYLYRAMILEKLGRGAEALRDYEAARGLDPTLAPLAADGIARLGGGGARSTATAQGKLIFRGGAIALSTLLIVLGLMGTAAGRSLTKRTRMALTPAGRPEGEPVDVARTVAAGDFIGGHYRIMRELGRGGMGVVYQAFDETLQRPVAIKQLQRDGRGDMGELERFLHEARMVAQLKHEHIAEIHAVVGGGDILLVFEYVDGRPLDQLMAGGKRLPPAEVRRLVSEIGSALGYAHDRKIVHRDLKPSNVMIAKNGASKVMDFGIAHQSRSGADATQTTFVSGTPPYMSPEQMMGSVSRAADVYALGVMTYELLTGRRPFEGPDYMEQKLHRTYAPVTRLDPSLPPALDVFFEHVLEPDPTKRIADARVFEREFAAAFGATPSRA